MERVTCRKAKQLTAGATTPDLTADEITNVMRALRVLRTRHGGTRALANALGVRVATVENGMKARLKPSGGHAVEVLDSLAQRRSKRRRSRSDRTPRPVAVPAE